MKKILLTGGSGFVGRHTIDLLIDRGYEVHAVFNEKEPVFTRKENLFWHQCNLLNFSEQKQIFDEIKPTHLLHFAWYVKHETYWMSLENFKWVQASVEIVNNFIENGGNRAVFAGSSIEYDWSYGYCSEKVTPLQPLATYGVCKNSLHEMLKKISNQTEISYAWGRVFFIYGPHEYSKKLVASIICSLLKNQVANCLNGNLIRDFLHVHDVASAFVSLLESNVIGPVNIASGKPIALKDIVNTIADKLNKRELVQFGESSSPINEYRLVVADIKRLNSEVGWIPTYNLENGLDQTINWWKDQRIDK